MCFSGRIEKHSAKEKEKVKHYVIELCFLRIIGKKSVSGEGEGDKFCVFHEELRGGNEEFCVGGLRKVPRRIEKGSLLPT